jgi:hypothetical protein
MNQATSSIIATNIAITIKATDTIVTITDLIIRIETIDATIALDATTRTQRAPNLMTRRISQAQSLQKKEQ